MVECISAKENYVCKTQIGNHAIQSDTTPDKGGKGNGIRPHDILASAFASCLNISVRMACEKLNVPFEKITTKIELIRKEDETVFTYKIDFHQQLAEETKNRVLEAAQMCAVRKTLSKKLSFEYINE